MKTSLKTALISALLATGAAGLVIAGPGGKGDCERDGDFMKKTGHHPEGERMAKGPGGEREMRKAPDAQEMLQRMTKRLDLTEAQQADVKKILTESQTSRESLQQKMQANREQWQELMQSDSFDESKAHKIALAQGQIKADMMVEQARSRSQINALLTEEQRQQLGKRIERPQRPME